MDQYPVQGAVKILHSLHATETRMNSILTGHMARLQTLPLLMEVLVVSLRARGGERENYSSKLQVTIRCNKKHITSFEVICFWCNRYCNFGTLGKC